MVMFLYRTVQFPKRSYGPHTVCNSAPKLFFFSSLPVISFGLIFFLDGWISFIRISPLYLFLPPFFFKFLKKLFSKYFQRNSSNTGRFVSEN